MKILFSFNQDLNPYVNVIINGLRDAGCPVDVGTDKFWISDLFSYDIVHIQWPETLFDWRVPSVIELEFLKRRLKEIKSRAKVVYTRHNRISHHINDGNRNILTELYEVIEAECDAMVHLGEVSLEECANRPDLAAKTHVMIPIPVYDELYAPYLGITKQSARKKLGIPQKNMIVLAFGNFRFEAEKKLVIDALRGLRKRNITLLAPKWYKSRDYAFDIKYPMLTLRSSRKAFTAWCKGWKLGAKKIMTDEEVAIHFAAADVVFVQRLDELNSGNVPMAFLFGKVAVGPDFGNIGYWLRQSGNPVFPVGYSSSSTAQALRVAIEQLDVGQGMMNKNFATLHWNTRAISRMHKELYLACLHRYSA